MVHIHYRKLPACRKVLKFEGLLHFISCRLCLEEEESTFHVIAECPATQSVRSKVFELPIPTHLPDPPDWDVSQVVRFLRESPVGDMLDQD